MNTTKQDDASTKKLLGLFGGILVLGVGIGAYFLIRGEGPEEVATDYIKPEVHDGEIDYWVNEEGDAVKGSPDAPLTIVEFSDFECPYCARHFKNTLPKLIENYVITGKANYIFRDYPLDFHADAIPAALAANCAQELGGAKAYYDMHDLLFVNQDKLDRAHFLAFAQELRLEQEAFVSCYDAKETGEITEDFEAGKALGVTGTPASLLYKSGETEPADMIEGAYPYDTFEEKLDALLSQ